MQTDTKFYFHLILHPSIDIKSLKFFNSNEHPIPTEGGDVSALSNFVIQTVWQPIYQGIKFLDQQLRPITWGSSKSHLVSGFKTVIAWILKAKLQKLLSKSVYFVGSSASNQWFYFPFTNQCNGLFAVLQFF